MQVGTRDISRMRLRRAIWLEANPDFAIALLENEELDSLARITQKNAELAGYTVKIDKSFDIVGYLGFTLGIRVRF